MPKTERWIPDAAEVAPAIKVQAVRLVEIACEWDASQRGESAARDRLAARGFDPDLIEQLMPLLGEGNTAAVQVVAAQYGGILTSSASVLVVLNQWVMDHDGNVVASGTTVDVRLVEASPQWEVTDVRLARPSPPMRSPSAPARSLLANNRVKLPYAAAADVRSGEVSDSVLQALTSLSAGRVVDVSVLLSGHPIRVFGTDRRSSHTDGLAVDVWALDGRPVIDPRGRDAVAHFMHEASELGPFEVGGPVDFDGVGGRYFSDLTHQDHVHLGFPQVPVTDLAVAGG